MLRALAERWQGTALQNWSDEEIDNVAHYPNNRIYRFDEPATRLSLTGS